MHVQSVYMNAMMVDDDRHRIDCVILTTSHGRLLRKSTLHLRINQRERTLSLMQYRIMVTCTFRAYR